MPDLLFWKYDYTQDQPAKSPQELAALPSMFDLIDWKPDGWAWGEQELTDPRWRIVSWADADEPTCDSLLSPELPTLDAQNNPASIFQYREFYINLADPTFASQLPTVLAWWIDDARAEPIFVVPLGFSLNIASVKMTRAPVAPA